MGFKKANASRKPTLACVGTLSSIGAAKKSEHSDYYVMQLEIQGSYGCPNQRTNLIYLPDFFSPDCEPKKFDALYGEQSKGITFVYKKNVVGNENISLLEGLCGDPKTFEAFAEAKDQLTDFSGEGIGAFIRDFFQSLGRVEFGYTLKQKSDKGGVNADGKVDYILSAYYDVDEMFYLTESKIKSLINRQGKNQEKIQSALEAGRETPVEFRVKFDTEVFGISNPYDVNEPAWAA